MTNSNSSEYKKRNIAIWDEVAPRYHKRWAGTGNGPFQGTEKLVDMLHIDGKSWILDVACGTGAVTKKLSKKVGDMGGVVGADTSRTAIKIAKEWNAKKSNLHFVNADAENLGFSVKFDVVTCQYALFFFPDAPKALMDMRGILRDDGLLGISVHGKNTPFFSSMLDAITEFIPDYIPPGGPALDRYGTKHALEEVVCNAGFGVIKVSDHTFEYSPGTLEDYWDDHLRYVARPLREKIDMLKEADREILKEKVRNNAKPYTKKDGTITFPWQVLILAAKN